MIRHPEVFLAFNPLYAYHFLGQFPHLGAFVILGVVVLAITGGEAKYADIGHFARRGASEASERAQLGATRDDVGFREALRGEPITRILPRTAGSEVLYAATPIR